MAGNDNSSTISRCHCRSFSTYNPCTLCCSKRTIFVVTIFLHLCSLCYCQPNFNTSIGNSSVDGLTHKPKTESAIYSSSEENYYDYLDYEVNNSTGNRHGRRHDNTRIAQVVIYCSVILISLCGILIKYFVTQYETSQIKAQEQLSYHRLHNQVA